MAGDLLGLWLHVTEINSSYLWLVGSEGYLGHIIQDGSYKPTIVGEERCYEGLCELGKSSKRYLL